MTKAISALAILCSSPGFFFLHICLLLVPDVSIKQYQYWPSCLKQPPPPGVPLSCVAQSYFSPRQYHHLRMLVHFLSQILFALSLSLCHQGTVEPNRSSDTPGQSTFQAVMIASEVVWGSMPAPECLGCGGLGFLGLCCLVLAGGIKEGSPQLQHELVIPQWRTSESPRKGKVSLPIPSDGEAGVKCGALLRRGATSITTASVSGPNLSLCQFGISYRGLSFTA